MNLIVCESRESLARAASKWTADEIARTKARSIFIPAGQTPVELYALWEAEKPSCLKGVDLLQIDDVASGRRQGMFRTFFAEQLPSFQNSIRKIENGDRQADLAILGLGLNGHVAFHEPGLPADFYSGCVRLSPATCKNLDLEAGAWGLTYGAGAFNRCRSILMIIKGSSKRDILKRLQTGARDLPASHLLQHPNFTIIADREAAGHK